VGGEEGGGGGKEITVYRYTLLHTEDSHTVGPGGPRHFSKYCFFLSLSIYVHYSFKHLLSC